jgi:DNA-binding protein Fis
MKRQANYRSRIFVEHLCLLWLLKQKTKKPITELVAEALDGYFENVDWQNEGGVGDKSSNLG